MPKTSGRRALLQELVEPRRGRPSVFSRRARLASPSPRPLHPGARSRWDVQEQEEDRDAGAGAGATAATPADADARPATWRRAAVAATKSGVDAGSAAARAPRDRPSAARGKWRRKWRSCQSRQHSVTSSSAGSVANKGTTSRRRALQGVFAVRGLARPDEDAEVGQRQGRLVGLVHRPHSRRQGSTSGQAGQGRGQPA